MLFVPALALALVAAGPDGASGTNSLRVGAARVDITPPADPAYPPSGRYAHERLYVRAIVLDNGSARAALVGADLGGLGEDVWTKAAQQIAAELACPPENVVLSATHSHSAVPAGPPPAGFPRVPAEKTVDAVMDAVRQAKARLQPALAGFGTGLSYLNVNARSGKGT